MPAHAGAWIAPEGGQEIWTSIVGEREGVSFVESSGYIEGPVAEHTSVVFAPWIEQNYDTVEGWRGEATFGAKRALYRSEGGSVVAVQAGALWISHPNEGCGEGGAELRLLAGRGIGRTGFFNAEAATRALEGGCESDRLDLTIGYRPSENWMAMGQIFLDAPRQGDETVRAQLTLVRFSPGGQALQIGLRTRLDGGAEEAAIVVGLWGRTDD